MDFGLRVFEIKPSEGIGFIKLGTSMFQMVNLLKANNINDLRFIYSEHNMNHSPLTIEIINLSIRLTFEPICQKLILIEVNNWKSCKYIYHRELVNGNSTRIPNFKSIYNKFFGPTYPGEFKNETDNYLLSYPGICFKFELPQSLSKKMSNHSETPEMLIPIMDNYQISNINCTSFMIFKGSSREDAITSIKSLPNLKANDFFSKNISNEISKEDKKLINYLKNCTNLDLQRVIIEYCEIALSLGLITIHFIKHPRNLKTFRIIIGKTTMQDILTTLGQPDDLITKLVDSKIMIHNSSDNNDNDNGINTKSSDNNDINNNNNTIVKIHNYFRLGLDIVYDLNLNDNNEDDEDEERGSPVISKIICHNNLVNSLDFMKYERLLFILQCSSYTIYNTSLNTKNFQFEKGSQPMFLNRRDYELSIDSNDDFSSSFYLNQEDSMNSKINTSSCNNFEFIDFEEEIGGITTNPVTETLSNDTPQTSNSSTSLNASRSSSTSTAISGIDKASTWGLSKLQSRGRCVFEIMIDGEAISSLTLF